jgi:hypothetical protein
MAPIFAMARPSCDDVGTQRRTARRGSCAPKAPRGCSAANTQRVVRRDRVALAHQHARAASAQVGRRQGAHHPRAGSARSSGPGTVAVQSSVATCTDLAAVRAARRTRPRPPSICPGWHARGVNARIERRDRTAALRLERERSRRPGPRRTRGPRRSRDQALRARARSTTCVPYRAAPRPSLAPSCNGLQARSLECLRAACGTPSKQACLSPGQGQGVVGEGREAPTATEPCVGITGSTTAVVQSQKPSTDLLPKPRVAPGGSPPSAGRTRRTTRFRCGSTTPHGVRSAGQLELSSARSSRRCARWAQLAIAGVDAVHPARRPRRALHELGARADVGPARSRVPPCGGSLPHSSRSCASVSSRGGA